MPNLIPATMFAALPSLALLLSPAVSGWPCRAGDSVLEIPAVEILPHGESVRAVAADVKGERLLTVDSAGVVRGWDLDDIGAGEPLWASAEHRFAGSFDLSVGDEVGARSGPSPVPTFDSIDLETGGLSQGMGSSLGGSDMNDMNATKAVLVDAKDRWVWIGAKRGVARLMVKGSASWSQRGVPNGGVTALALDPKAKEIAIGGQDGTVRFVGNTSCDVDEKSVFEGHEDPVIAVAWHPKGKLVASTSGSDSVVFHRRRGGKVDKTLSQPSASLTELAFHPKGKWLAAGTAKGKVLIWNLKSGEVVAEAKLPKAIGGVHSLVVLDKGKELIAAGTKSIVRLDVSALGK